MKSVLDVGCGRGFSLAFFLENGIDAIGIEGSKLAIKNSKYPEKIQQKNLNKKVDLKRKFDVVWCFEVAEFGI